MVELILTGVIIALLVFLGWRDWMFSKQIEALSNKLLARDLPEYVRVTKDIGSKETKQPDKDRKKRSIDPVLGANF